MITLLKKHDYKENLWKNGLGKTEQIAIYPPDADLALNNFLWRISMAYISGPSPFSLFPQYARLLCVWKGDGLLLNQKPLLPFEVIQFSGDKEIYCDLLGSSEVTDLGVIYNKEKFKADLTVERVCSSSISLAGPGVHFLLLAEGVNCRINDFTLAEGEALRYEQNDHIHIHTEGQSKLVFLKISLLSI